MNCVICYDGIQSHESWHHDHEGLKHIFCEFAHQRVHVGGQEALAKLAQTTEMPFQRYMRKPYWVRQIKGLTKI